MSDLHRNSRFLRFLRSICSKTAFARRAIVALFVAVATILATFMIMPSASMGASSQGGSNQVQAQSQTKSESAESNTASSTEADAKNESSASGKNGVKNDAKDSQTSSTPESSSASSAQNVDPTKQQQNNAAEGANKAADKDVADAAKDAEKSKSVKRSKRQKRSAKEDDRAAAGNVELPKECKDAGITELAKCYVAEYFYTIKRKKGVAIKKSITINSIGESHTITPVFRRVKKINNKGIPTIDEKTDASSSVKGLIESFSLERLSTESTALESNVENNDFVKVDPTSGEIKIHANKWLNNGSYYVFVKVKYKDNSTLTRSQWCTNSCSPSYNKYSRFSIQIRYKNPTNDVLSLKVYNHQEQDADRAEVDEKKGVTFTSGEDGRFSPITPIFIDTTSSKRPNLIYHRMVCHKDGDETKGSDYYLNSINGLTLSASASSTGQTTQKQWKHVPGVRPANDTLSESSGNLYESDDIIERSQSWIAGTPKEAGTFICKVLALKDIIKVSSSTIKVNTPTFVQVFDSKINDNKSTLKQDLFNEKVKVEKIFSAYAPQPDSTDAPPYNPYGIFESGTYKRGKVWDVKTIKIEVKSNKKQQLVVGDNDLALKVYPFKNGDGSLPAALSDKNNKISAMLGMELKPSIEATSEADSQKAITLKMLCSKGEEPQKTNAGGAGGTSNSDGTSNGVAAGGSGTTGNTDNKGLVYTKWEEPSKLGFTFPDENAQKPCTSEKDKQTCSLEGSTKNFAATTNVSATFKSAEAGDYQCVVYALKPDALTKFNEEAAKTGVTPEKISTAFAGAKLTANKNLAKLTINIHVPEKFTLPHTGEWNWNLQLGAIAAVMVSVLAAGFVASQSDSYRKLFYERRRC